VGLVGQDGNVHLAKTSLLSRGVDPGQVRELGVGAGGNDLAANGSELLGAVREADDLGWAHKGAKKLIKFSHSDFETNCFSISSKQNLQVKRVEEED
jgi:hypothetical protein